MIYLDSSVALAQVMSERRRPPDSFWRHDMISSRLLQYEVWNRVHAYGADRQRLNDVRRLLDEIDFVEMTEDVLARALSPFDGPVRTLDGLHLATLQHLSARGATVALASYDSRLLASARGMGFETVAP